MFKHRWSAMAMAGGAMLCMPAGALELSIFGVGNLSADSIDTGPSSSSYVHSNSSRLGFSGSHDLTSAYQAIFRYESGADLTGRGTGDGNGGASSGGQIFTRTRDAFVGLKTAVGTVMFGRVGGLNQWVYDYNLFGDQVGDLGNIFGGDGLPGRLNGTISYKSPDFSGLSVGATVAPNQGATNNSNAVFKADFASSALKVGAAYAAFGNGAGNAYTKVGALTGSYDFGMFNVGGGAQRQTDIGGVNNTNRNSYTVGAAAGLGASGTVMAQYARANDLNNTNNTGASQWALGYHHALDKSTTLFVDVAKTNNDSGATFTSFNYGHGDNGVPAILPGRDNRAISVGIVYKFDASVFKR